LPFLHGPKNTEHDHGLLGQVDPRVSRKLWRRPGAVKNIYREMSHGFPKQMK
jgi:hypothetical protein